MSRKDKALLGIILAVPLVLGFIIGLTVGGYVGERPYVNERALITERIKAAKNDDNLACAVVAWIQPEPVDELWWNRCQSGFQNGEDA